MSRARERESRRNESRSKNAKANAPGGSRGGGNDVEVRRTSSCVTEKAGSKGQGSIQLFNTEDTQPSLSHSIQRVQREISKRLSHPREKKTENLHHHHNRPLPKASQLPIAQLIGYAQPIVKRSVQRVQSEIDKKLSHLREKKKDKSNRSRTQSSHLLPVAQIVGGKQIQLEAVRKRIKRGGGSKDGFTFRECFTRLSRKVFIPENVSSDYWAYVRWRFIQRISAAMLSVYSTDCMLRAVGVGAKRSLPTAAAFNWLLKDGIGKLGKLAIVARLGSQYDLELKKFRFLSTVICDISCGLEMLTPFSPKNFLLLASMGNMGKSVGLSIALAAQPAFHKKFALADNMADITAKSQAQHVVADTIGLGLALGMSQVATGISPQMRAALPILSFPLLAALDVILVHNELRAIDLKTLNRDRSQVLSSHWIANKCVLPMGKVSRMENMAFLPFSPEGTWPLKVQSLSAAIPDIDLLSSYLECYHKEGYMLIPRVKQFGPFMTRKSLSLAYSSSASERDMLKGILQASYFRMLEQKQEPCLAMDKPGRAEKESGRKGGQDYTDVLKKSKLLAEQNISHFMKDVASRGWQTSPLLLFDSGYPAYVLTPDWRKWCKEESS